MPITWQCMAVIAAPWAEGLKQVQGQPGLRDEFQTSQDYRTGTKKACVEATEVRAQSSCMGGAANLSSNPSP